TSEAELDLSDQGVGVSGAALVNRLLVSITVRTISVWIVSVIRIGIVKERSPKSPKKTNRSSKWRWRNRSLRKPPPRKPRPLKPPRNPPPLNPALPKAPPLARNPPPLKPPCRCAIAFEPAKMQTVTTIVAAIRLL